MNTFSITAGSIAALIITLRRSVFLAGTGMVVTMASVSAQQTVRGGVIPNANAQQTAALTRMARDLAQPMQALTAARSELVAAAFTTPRSDVAIRAKVDAVRAAEQALAKARADAFASIQASTNRLAPDQLAALIAMGGTLRAPVGRATGSMCTEQDICKGAFFTTPEQTAALTAMSMQLAPQRRAVTTARNELLAASLALPRNDAMIRAKLDALCAAERTLAQARADAFGGIQASASKLTPYQVAQLIDAGGTRQGRLSEAAPMDFSDHEGYVSLFDGVTLKGWDGNPKFWRVEDGAIVGESTTQNPSGNSYIVYRDIEAKDFTLKLEVKIEGSGGTGIQYRSRTGLPWLSTISPAVTANVGPVNLNWMMTGPQADFWPSTPVWTGQFYSENTPMRVLAWRGQVVEAYGNESKRLMGTIGDRMALASAIKLNEWNQYTVIARGGTFIHIINGQLMSVLVDDDANSSNNQSGQIGIEIEATTKVSVRNIWLKKLN